MSISLSVKNKSFLQILNNSQLNADRLDAMRILALTKR